MIVVKIKGGLGNQMFQYACGRSVALAKNDTLKLDLSSLSSSSGKDTARDYKLDNFNILEHIASPKEKTEAEHRSSKTSLIKRVFRKAFGTPVSEPTLEKILKSHASYLDGFWQSERYFKAIEETLRIEFTLKRSVSAGASKWFPIIANNTSLAVHVRRGDYVSDPATRDFHGLCSPDYYHQAIKMLSEKTREQFKVFVFSDDIEWVKQNLNFSRETYFVSGEGLSDFEEMHLMSLCDHQIIANSSFSWWAAWLNKNESKIVIAPKKWFAGSSENSDNIVPDEWIKI